jgi:uncharacterized peroxidase-related enzyme
LADALLVDYRAAPLEPKMKDLLSFAEKVARDPRQINQDEIAKLRSEGFSDRAILDATHVVGFFSYMNRIVQALGADDKAGASVLQRTDSFPAVSSFSNVG